MPALDLRIGIDVGGTNTDAVVLDRAAAVIARVKVPTTADVTGGIRNALAEVLEDLAVEPARVTHVMLGTTHATNAILERRRLGRVAVLRIGGPATHAIRPLFGWPEDLRETVCAGTVIVDGGSEYDGRELVPFDREAAARFIGEVGAGADAIAITSVFSPASPDHERRARELVSELLGVDKPVSLGHEVGSLGLIERENATVLNATLAGVAREVGAALGDALEQHRIDAVVYFAQNDGTLMALGYAMRFPVLTIGSGPANSLRGAAYLTGISDAIVADVGGTSTDLGVLVAGFPRESAAAVEIGGVRTNFRMPDVLSIALGGGTIIGGSAREVVLGPGSVGYELTRRALSFGGDTPTMTDAMVHAGRARIGTRPNGDGALFGAALACADAMIAAAVDRMKVGQEPRPLIAVGGGSVLVPDDVPGASEVLRPHDHDVANAIGAAIALASGRWEEVVELDRDRRGALDGACARARDRAIEAGADPAAVEIVELEEVPLAYLNRPTVRVRVKAAGPLGSI